MATPPPKAEATRGEGPGSRQMEPRVTRPRPAYRLPRRLPLGEHEHQFLVDWQQPPESVRG